MLTSGIPIMLIGAMKCGTSTLYSLLKKHPEICAGVIKEPNYFAKVMGIPKFKNGTYNELFEFNHSIHKFTLDASTSYSKYPSEKGVAKRIKDYGLDPYFIYIVRNPFDRITSHYNFMRKSDLWENEITADHYINLSMYYTQLQQYEKYFSQSKILLIDFDDLKISPADVCKRIFDFIGASVVELPSESVAAKNKTIGFNKTQFAIKSNLSKYAKFSPSILNKMVNKSLELIFPGKLEKLSLKDRDLIKMLLKEDMHMLKRAYSFDVSKWGF